jgi:hypothetical protein
VSIKQKEAKHKRRTPKIKVFRHVDLFEDSHEPLFFARLLDLVAGGYSEHLRFLTVIHVVSAE